MTANGRTRGSGSLPAPDFTDSRQLRLYVDQTRRILHAAAMHLHMSAEELRAGLSTIPAPPGTMMPRSVQRRRARRVSRHMAHAAECLVDGSAAMVRTWGAFRAEYAPELGPVRKARKTTFRVVPE